MSKRVLLLSAAAGLLSAAIFLSAVALPVAGAWHLESAPTPRQALQTGNVVASACSAVITETAAPTVLRLCETSAVTVTAALTCPIELPVHLVIVIDRSKSMADTSNPTSSRILQDVKRSARSAIDALDWTIPGTMVGVVSHGFRVTTQTDLTETKSRAIGGVNAVRYDPGDLGEDPGKAIARAQQMLERKRAGSSPLEVIVLYGDGCDPTVQGCETSSRRAAAQAAGFGISVMPVCYKESDRADCPDYRALASEPRYYFESGNRVPRAVEQIEDTGRHVSIDSSLLLETLASDVQFAPGSGVPAPALDEQSLEFSFDAVTPGDLITATYRVSVSALGTLPLRTGDSALTIVDSLDRESEPIPIPPRSITVTGPCVNATPTPTATSAPTATAVPSATETATLLPTTEVPPTVEGTRTATPGPATATPNPSRAFLPVLLKDACKPSELHTNVMLVIDASTSMDQQAGEATKLQAAKHAALTFVDMLQLGYDYAGVVAFNNTAHLLSPLTADGGALRDSIARIETARGTRIDLAIESASAALREGSVAVGQGNNRVMVLLTDGRPDAGTAPLALATANEAKADGIIIYAIGLGSDVDSQLLRSIASSDDTYLEAPTAADLERIYREIAGKLPCPGGEFWPVR